jgi:nucleotide-binding universal stress UspA family protein
MSIEHILITSDLSPDALRPCEPVAGMAKALGARITILHVIQSVPGTPLSPTGEQVPIHEELQARVILARTQLELQTDAFKGVDLTVEVLPGIEVVSTVLEYAEAKDVDMIAISKHDRSGFQRLIVGSVAEALIRRSPLPVIVFPRVNSGPRAR